MFLNFLLLRFGSGLWLKNTSDVRCYIRTKVVNESFNFINRNLLAELNQRIFNLGNVLSFSKKM